MTPATLHPQPGKHLFWLAHVEVYATRIEAELSFAGSMVYPNILVHIGEKDQHV